MNARSTLSRSLVSSFALLAVLVPTRLAHADELKLDDGRVLVGKVVERGDTYEVTTHDGVVVVQKAKVVQLTTDAKLREKLAERARTAGNTPFAHLQLAMDARDYGLEPELWRHLDAVVEALPSNPANADETTRGLRRRCDEFLAQLEREILPRKFRSAPTAARVHELLDRLRTDTGAGRAAAIEALLVREPNADQHLRTEARQNGSPRRRIGALSALQRRELAGNDRFVLRTSVLDNDADVRRSAIELVRGHDDAAAVAYLAPGLLHGNSKVRVRTAEAFADLGHADAVKMLVLAGPNAGKALASADSGIRAHVAFLNQQAYIRDFDVEVAQAAFIADPKIGVLTSGVVLDVTNHGVYEEIVIVRAWQKALKDLTKSDPGPNPRMWATWLANLQPQSPTPTTPPTTTPR